MICLLEFIHILADRNKANKQNGDQPVQADRYRRVALKHLFALQ